VRLSRKLLDVAFDERGASIIELAIIAPFLVAICLFTVDLGLAINEKMSIGHAVRVGADRAMADPGESTVQVSTVQAMSKNFSSVSETPYPPQGTSSAVHVQSSRFCACPDSRTVPIACTATCTAGKAPLAFYRISAKKRYASALFPDMVFDSVLQVQVR
jgi:pilus assembly protein CpaE